MTANVKGLGIIFTGIFYALYYFFYYLGMVLIFALGLGCVAAVPIVIILMCTKPKLDDDFQKPLQEEGERKDVENQGEKQS